MRPSQLGEQSSSRAASANGDHRTWTHNHPTKPRFLAGFEQNGSLGESMTATAGGEPAHVSLEFGYGSEPLTWNAAGMLHRYKESSYSFDVFGATTLVVTGAGGVTTQIVSVGADFEYDIGASRANKHFTLGGVRIASLATSYTACSAPCPASAPPALRIALRFAEPLAAPAAAALFALGLASLASLTLRRRTPVWLSLPGVGVLSLSLVALPYTAQAATLTTGAGKYGRHAEPILAYLVDHLGTVRAAVNRDGIVVETRDYAPYGESIAHVGAFSVQHRFTGQPQDDLEGGLYNYGARFYNPKWGRFVSPDEVVQGFDSQGLNPYTYVLNRPTSGTDPTGNFGGFDGAVGVGSYFSGGIGSMGSIGGGLSSGNGSLRWFAAGPRDVDRPSRRSRVDSLRRYLNEFAQSDPAERPYSIKTGGRELNPRGFVLANPQVRDAVRQLYEEIAKDVGNEKFTFEVTGGDRYVDPEGNIRSSTTGDIESDSSRTSPHLISRGARAADLRIRGVSPPVVDRALGKTPLSPANTDRSYKDGHTHVALPNRPEFYHRPRRRRPNPPRSRLVR